MQTQTQTLPAPPATSLSLPACSDEVRTRLYRTTITLFVAGLIATFAYTACYAAQQWRVEHPVRLGYLVFFLSLSASLQSIRSIGIAFRRPPVS